MCCASEGSSAIDTGESGFDLSRDTNQSANLKLKTICGMDQISNAVEEGHK